MSDDRLYLIHIAESIEKIEDYTRGGWDWVHGPSDGTGCGGTKL